MNAGLTSWVRTVVPGLWSMVVAWAVTLGLPDTVTTAAAGLGEAVLFPVALAAVYALLRRLEPRMPDCLTRALLGSAKVPTYGQAADGTPAITTLPPRPGPID